MSIKYFKPLINRKNKYIDKLIEDIAMADAVKREKIAENKILIIFSEIAKLLRDKGIKEFNGQGFTMKIE